MLASGFGVFALSLLSSLPVFRNSSAFVGLPQASNNLPSISFSVTFSMDGSTQVTTFSWNGGNEEGIRGEGDFTTSIAGWGSVICYAGGEYLDISDSNFYCQFGLSYRPSVSFVSDQYINTFELDIFEDDLWYVNLGTYGENAYDFFEQNHVGDVTLDINITEYSLPSYSLTSVYEHCSYTQASGDKALPSSYTSATLDNNYFFRVDASTGYRFRKDGSAISTTGGITIVNVIYNTLNVGDFADWFTIELTLPLADCSIAFIAVNGANLTQNLSACTSTFPSSYTFGQSGTYRIVANDGYCFDSNLTQYSTTGMVVTAVSYANRVYGDLYTTIVLDVTFGNASVASVTATAQTYSADYAQGWRDGESSGLELKGGLMDLIPNVFASIGAFFFTFAGVNFMGINLLAVVGIVVAVGLIGVIIKVALK